MFSAGEPISGVNGQQPVSYEAPPVGVVADGPEEVPSGAEFQLHLPNELRLPDADLQRSPAVAFGRAKEAGEVRDNASDIHWSADYPLPSVVPVMTPDTPHLTLAFDADGADADDIRVSVTTPAGPNVEGRVIDSLRVDRPRGDAGSGNWDFATRARFIRAAEAPFRLRIDYTGRTLGYDIHVVPAEQYSRAIVWPQNSVSLALPESCSPQGEGDLPRVMEFRINQGELTVGSVIDVRVEHFVPRDGGGYSRRVISNLSSEGTPATDFLGQYSLDVEGDNWFRVWVTLRNARGVEVHGVLLNHRTSVANRGTLAGMVVDEDGAAVQEAAVIVTAPDGVRVGLTTDADGVFSHQGILSGDYHVRVEANGFLMHGRRNIHIEAGRTTPLPIHLHRRPRSPLVRVQGDRITISRPVRFRSNSAEIDPDSHPMLEEVADAILRNPEFCRIEIQGHTDWSGAPERNRTLSQERAQAVVDFLIQTGVAADRLNAIGYGPDRPVAPNITAAGRERNRRIEFHITERCPPATPAP